MKLFNFYVEFQDYKKFIVAAINRTRSVDNYFIFQSIQGELIYKYLLANGIKITDFSVIDLANGFGGETQVLGKKCRFIVGLDLNFLNKNMAFPHTIGNAMSTPFKDRSFDLVICASLIEHLLKPELLLEEIDRILKPNGIAYISFPPFYSLNGGHDYAPFHLFGEKLGNKFSKYFIKLFNKKRFGTQVKIIDDYQVAFGNWGLYIMTIKKMRQLISNSKFILLDQSTKWLPINFSKIPLIGEFLTWHVQFIIRKIDDEKSIKN